MKIVREKYMSQLPGAKDKMEMQRFLSELYVFLVDQMHVGLKKVRQPQPHTLTQIHTHTLSLGVCVASHSRLNTPHSVLHVFAMYLHAHACPYVYLPIVMLHANIYSGGCGLLFCRILNYITFSL